MSRGAEQAAWEQIRLGMERWQLLLKEHYEGVVKPQIAEITRTLSQPRRDCRAVCGEVSGPLRDRICKRGHALP